jgi:hypothetical protein
MKTSLLATYRSSALAAAIMVSSMCAGCGSIKFYPGEERADSEIGRILFNSSGASMSVVTLDGVPHPHPGRTLEILPGRHTLVVKYEQTFVDSGDPAHRSSSGEIAASSGEIAASSGEIAPLKRFGTCSIPFTIEAAQELYVFVDAVADSGLSASAPPTITLRPTGFDQPALFQERCREESTARRESFSPQR